MKHIQPSSLSQALVDIARAGSAKTFQEETAIMNMPLRTATSFVTAPSDPIYMVERDFGPKIGTELMGYREHTRAKIVDLLAFEYLDAVKVLEIREDEHSVSDITEEILEEAAQMRADSSQFGVGA